MPRSGYARRVFSWLGAGAFSRLPGTGAARRRVCRYAPSRTTKVLDRGPRPRLAGRSKNRPHDAVRTSLLLLSNRLVRQRHLPWNGPSGQLRRPGNFLKPVQDPVCVTQSWRLSNSTAVVVLANSSAAPVSIPSRPPGFGDLARLQPTRLRLGVPKPDPRQEPTRQRNDFAHDGAGESSRKCHARAKSQPQLATGVQISTSIPSRSRT